jgi:hypothetical protein
MEIRKERVTHATTVAESALRGLNEREVAEVIASLISGGFAWSGTEQGIRYWCNVENNLRALGGRYK